MPTNSLAIRDSFDLFRPSFTGISTHGQLRFLAHNHLIRCPYCKKGMIYTGDIVSMQRAGIFSGDVKTFIQAVEPYKKRLKDVNRIILNKIEKYARKAPQTTLSAIMQDLYTNSIRKLRKSQIKIFKQLLLESNNLSPETSIKFKKFMGIQIRRLKEEPYIETFHGKTFKYKINKMYQTLGHNDEVKTYIGRIISKLDEPIFKDDNAILPAEISETISSRFKDKKITSKEAKLYIINRLQRIGERFDRRDITELCKTSRKMIQGLPVKVPFSNKEFMHDLVKYVLNEEGKTENYYSMIKIAQQLPSSLSNTNSFIVKWRYSDSDTIGYKLLDPSSATVEHVHPTSEGGIDNLSNWVLACKADNSARMSTKLFKFLKKFSPNNPQAYFDDIIKISNTEGTFTKKEIEETAKTFEKEGHTKIKLNKLKN